VLDLLEIAQPQSVRIEPFPVPETSVRRRVVGLDVWLETRPRASSPLGRTLVAALASTALRLTHLEDLHGRLVWPSAETVTTAATQNRARLMLRDEDAHLTDQAIAEALAAVGGIATWSLVRKLEEFDAVEAFAPLGCSSRTTTLSEDRT